MKSKKPISYPDLSSEVEMGFLHSGLIIGVDEVGRGCLAGPVVAAAAILHSDSHSKLDFCSKGLRTKKAIEDFDPLLSPILKVRDSKLVPEEDRAPMADAVRQFVRGSAIGEASVEEIETLNILYASHLAMERAVSSLEKSLGIRASAVLVDGNIVPRAFVGRGHALIKGDGRSLTIACASIIAKVYRDEMMHELQNIQVTASKNTKGIPPRFIKNKFNYWV